MRILQICKKFPYPVRDGEAVAVQTLSRGFGEHGHQTALLAFNTSKHFVHIRDSLPGMEQYESIDSVFLDNSIDPVKAFINLFTDKSFNIERFNSDRFHQRLKHLLTRGPEIDIVQLESLYMAPYISTIRKYSRARVVMRSHNLEYEIWDNLARGSRNPLKKWYFNMAAKRLKIYEKECFKLYDLLLPISSTDHQKYQELEYSGPVCIAPVGLDPAEYPVTKSHHNRPLTLGYIGSLDWIPNIEGIKWFLEHSWPEIRRNYPDISFHLAGRNASPQLLKILPPDIHFHGEVGDAIDFLKKLDIVIVPLFSGSGIRVKILESMVMGKIVISTEKGFEGIGITDGKNGFLFKAPQDILEAIRTCYNEPDTRRHVETSARSWVSNHFGYKSIAGKVLDAYEKILTEQHTAS